jgi:hypothetical protein
MTACTCCAGGGFNPGLNPNLCQTCFHGRTAHSGQSVTTSVLANAVTPLDLNAARRELLARMERTGWFGVPLRPESAHGPESPPDSPTGRT